MKATILRNKPDPSYTGRALEPNSLMCFVNLYGPHSSIAETTVWYGGMYTLFEGIILKCKPR